MRARTQPPLFAEPCSVCRYAVPGEHEPYCPSFMRGAEPGGDPHEWPTLLDELELEGIAETPAPIVLEVIDHFGRNRGRIEVTTEKGSEAA